MIKYDKITFKKVCREAESMAKAASQLGLHFNTFKKHAINLGCYNPNQGGIGINKKSRNDKIPLESILENKHPQYQTFKLKVRLIDEGVFENVCSICGISEWNDQFLTMELDHINGDRTYHHFDNLRLLCPNCHSQTDTYRAKNKSLSREIC